MPPWASWAASMLFLTWLSEAHLLMERTDEALQIAGRSLALSHEHQERGNQAYALRLLGDISARRDPPETAQAEAYYQQALALAEELGMRPLRPTATTGWAGCTARPAAGAGPRRPVHRHRPVPRHGHDLLAAPGRSRAGAGECVRQYPGRVRYAKGVGSRAHGYCARLFQMWSKQQPAAPRPGHYLASSKPPPGSCERLDAPRLSEEVETWYQILTRVRHAASSAPRAHHGCMCCVSSLQRQRRAQTDRRRPPLRSCPLMSSSTTLCGTTQLRTPRRAARRWQTMTAPGKRCSTTISRLS